MPYYMLERSGGALYSMNMILSEEEARRYGKEGEMVPVQALFVWTDAGELETFRHFLSAIEQGNPNSPFVGLIRDMRANRVKGLELSADQARDRLRKYRAAPFVCIDPGPNQRVRQTKEFLAQLEE